MSSIDYNTYIKKFQLVQPLGKGNYSEVYELRQRQKQQTYALKLTQFCSYDQLATAFQQIQVIQALAHPSVVKVYYYFLRSETEEGDEKITLGIIMEKGNYNLQYLINQRRNTSNPFTIDEINSFVFCIAGCLACMQEKGYMHRDIKPENILVFHDDEIKFKICDFGLAIRNHDFASETIAGTYQYASPKLKYKFKNKSIKCYGNTFKDDVFSLGITVMEMCLLQPCKDICGGLKRIEKEYGYELCKIISKMVNPSEVKRIDFKGIMKEYVNEKEEKITKVQKKQKKELSLNQTKKKQKIQQYYQFSHQILCFEPIVLSENTQIVFVACSKMLGILYKSSVHEIKIPDCFGQITCFCYDHRNGFIWFGSIDTYLRRISLERLFYQLENQTQLSIKSLNLASFGKLQPISCLCVGPENEPLIGYYNGQISVNWEIKPLKVHQTTITSIKYLNDEIYSSCINGMFQRQTSSLGKKKRIQIALYRCQSGIIDFSFINGKKLQIILATVSGYIHIIYSDFECKSYVKISEESVLAISFEKEGFFMGNVKGQVIDKEGKKIYEEDGESREISCLKKANRKIIISHFDGVLSII